MSCVLGHNEAPMVKAFEAHGKGADRRLLVLMRHGESVWNRQGLFTGLADVELTSEGRSEAEAAARGLATQGLTFDLIFTSTLIRARESAEIILAVLGVQATPIISASALNERDYGELTGLDEASACQRFGNERVRMWRRGYAERPPCGESLLDVRQRMTRFHTRVLLPEIAEGRRLLVVGHGNSLRALVMELEDISPEQVETLEIATAESLVYECTLSGQIRRQLVRRQRKVRKNNDLLER